MTNINFKIKYHKKRKKKSAFYVVKCMDCRNRFKIYVPDSWELKNFKDESFFEINGVVGTKVEWIEFFKKIKLIEEVK